MNPRTRRRLFYAFCLAFVLIGTSAVLFTQGWRFDFGSWSLTKVGGIFIRSSPRDASIFLDGVPVKNNTSWLFQSGTFINSLFPKTYLLALEKPGFRAWKRHISVAPSLVSEIPNAVLVPSHVTLLPSSTTLPFPLVFDPPFPVLTATSSLSIAEAKNSSRSSSTVRVTGVSRITSSTPLLFDSPVVELQWNNRGTLGILEQSGALWEFNPASGYTEKIGDDVLRFAWNGDGTKIGALERHSMEIFDRENPEEGYRRFNIPDIGSAERILWYRDDMHLFLIFPSRTVFLDLNDANLENLTEVTSTDQVAYNPDVNTLYYRTDATSTLQMLEFPR